LAWVYWNKHYWETFFSEDLLDSFLVLTDIALSYDDQLSEAYTFKGSYYSAIGKPEQAEYYFNIQLEYCYESIELGREYAEQVGLYYDLAGVYAFRGKKDKAYENLRIFNQRQWMPFFIVTLIKDDPLFDPIRDEPEFQQIVRDVEAKYQAEHERVRKWLEEQGAL